MAMRSPASTSSSVVWRVVAVARPVDRRAAARELVGAACSRRGVAGLARLQAVDRAGKIVDPVEGHRQAVLAVLAHAHDRGLVVAPAGRLGDRHRPRHAHHAVARSEVGEAERAAERALDRVRPPRRRSTPPAPRPTHERLHHRALRLLVEQPHQVGIEVGLQRLLRQPAGPGVAARGGAGEAEAVGAEVDADAGAVADMVWNSRLWSAPLVQPPPSESSTSGLEANDIWEWAIAVRARASSRPLGVPRPVVEVVARPGRVAVAGRRDVDGAVAVQVCRCRPATNDEMLLPIVTSLNEAGAIAEAM